MELTSWLSFLLEEFLSFDLERGRRSSAKARTLSLHLCKLSKNRVTAVPAASMFLFENPLLGWPWIWCARRESRGRILMQVEALLSERRFSRSPPPPLALNLRLLSDRCLVNNRLLSSLLNAVFIGLKKLAGKRCKGKSRTIWK